MWCNSFIDHIGARVVFPSLRSHILLTLKPEVFTLPATLEAYTPVPSLDLKEKLRCSTTEWKMALEQSESL